MCKYLLQHHTFLVTITIANYEQCSTCTIQSLICVLVVRLRRCHTLSNPVPWQNWMAAYLGYTLQMRTLFPGWPIIVHDTHTRKKRKKERIHSLTISYQARHKHKTAGAEHSRSRPVPHCRVLPPDEFDSITSDLSPGCTESYVMTAETIFTQVIRNKETKVRNIVITLI